MHKLWISLTCVTLALPASAQDDERAFLRDQVLGAMPWRHLGPTTFGGRIVDIEVDPTRRQTVYAASATGGLWKTVNAGNTFVRQFDQLPVHSIGDLAIAPSDPNVLYLGTGEANNQRSSYWGDGVYKSTDAGASWTWVGLRGTDHIGRIVVHPTDPNRVYVAALGALYTPNEERGLYRSVDGGSTWKCVKHVSADVGFVDVILDPQNPDTLFAASYERRRRAHDFDESGPGSAIWKSTDGGDTWAVLEGGLPDGEIGRIGLALCASQPNVVYAIVENRNPAPKPEPKPEVETEDEPRDGEADPYAQTSPGFDEYADREEEDEAPGARRRLVGGEVWRSDDGGTTWHKPHEKAVAGSPHYYYGQIRVAHDDPDRLVVLGVQAWHSKDGAKTWKRDYARRLHVDHHALWLDPADPSHAWLGNDGGLAETWDDGANWRYVNELPLAQFYTVSVDDRVPYTIYGGTQDNGTWAIPSRTTDQFRVGHADTMKVAGGDGFYVGIDPENPDILYAESQFGAISRVDVARNTRKSIRPRTPKGSPKLRFNWMSPIHVSQHAPQTVYFGSQYVHRSRNRGDDWEVISPDLSTNDADKLRGDVPHCTVTTIDESAHHADWLLAGTDDGNVWMTRTGGKRWVDLTDRFEGLPKALWVSRVAFSPSDAKTIYVSFTGYREDIREPYVFMSDDGGDSFRSIANDLPRSPVNVVREHPRNSNVLFVGHEFGVSVSIDGGGTWNPLGASLPTTPVHDLVVHPRVDDLVIATHGQGMFVLDITALADLDASVLQRPFHAFAARDGFRRGRGYPTVRYPGASPWRADRTPDTALFRYYLKEDADAKVKIAVYDVRERLVFETEGPETAGLHTVAWGGAATRGTTRRRGGGGPAAGEYLAVFEFGGREYERRVRVFPAPGGPAAGSGDDEELEEEASEEGEGDEHDDQDADY